MNDPLRPASRRLAGRLLTWYGIAAAIGLVAFEVALRLGVGPRWAAWAIGVAGVPVVAVLARRAARPLEGLTGVAGRVAEGAPDVRPRRSGVYELDRLGQAIGAMASEMGSKVRDADEERRTLESVLGALPQGIVLVGEADRIVYSNHSAAELLGAIPAGAGGLVPRGINRAVREAGSAGATVHVDVDHGAPPRRLSATATPMEGDGLTMLVVEDITERIRVEAMRRDFVADASHELKTPVAALIASIEALELALEHDPGRAAGFAGRMEASAHQLARMIEDLLDLSRLEASDVPDDLVALHEVVEREAARLAASAASAGVRLDWRIQEAVVRGSEADLALAIRNLGDNAIRYTDSGGSVSIELRTAGGRAFVSVSDSGTGIPTRLLGRVFERFFRVDEARSRATGGTGLGLAIVKHVSERHGGTVAVESQLGAGSTFTIELPVILRGDDPPAPPTRRGS